VIKHREFSSLDRAHNARLDEDLYVQRSQVETVFSVLKRRFGETGSGENLVWPVPQDALSVRRLQR